MINIEIVYAEPKRQIIIPLQIENPCTAMQAIELSKISDQIPELKSIQLKIGIYGKRIELNDLIKDGDRIEIYRELVIDPKQARLLRAKKKK